MIADFSAGKDPYARALARIAGRAARPTAAVPADERTVLELVTVLVAGRDAGTSVAYRAAARSFIEAHLGDPGLDAAGVAAAVGIERAAPVEGCSRPTGPAFPARAVRRLSKLAHAMLAGPAAAGRTVAEVAAACGFTSVTYFSHAFRQRFGQRAGEVRREAQAARLAPA